MTIVPEALCFTDEALRQFATASHDLNPLHVDPRYARRTVFGEPVVYGVLVALAAMQHLPLRANKVLSTLTAEFSNPATIGINYDVSVESINSEKTKLKVRDGRRVLLRLSASFRDGAVVNSTSTTSTGGVHRDRPVALSLEAITNGTSASGRYAADREALEAIARRYDLTARGVGLSQIEALMACSYLIGMELPGERALFSAVSLDFDEKPTAGETPALGWSLTVTSVHHELSVLTLAAEFENATRAKLTAFVRQPVERSTGAFVRASSTQRLAGKIAVITGASRGLGAALSRAMVNDGCTVVGTYLSSHDEIARLAQDLGEKFIPVYGDASDMNWGAETRAWLSERFEAIDYLVCNACPPLRPLWIEPASAVRVAEYVSLSVSMVNTPLAYLTDLVALRHGTVLVVSSSAVTDPPTEWPHYVSAKCAIEGLARACARGAPSVKVKSLRPPKLSTELVNTPLGRHDALDVDVYARRVVDALCDGPTTEGFVLEV